MKYVHIEGATKLNYYVKPMLAKLTDQSAFNDPDWLFEIKWDGYRAVAELAADDVRFYSRNGIAFHKAFPRIYEVLKTINQEAVLDGEVVAFDKEGKPSFQALQNYNNRKNIPVLYYVFDCLSYQGKNITNLPLLERKEILRQMLPQSKMVRYCDHIEEQGVEFYQQIVKAGLEGMIAKKKTSLYYEGKRTSAWLKIKNVRTMEAVIVGYTDPKGSRVGFGSLLLAEKKGVYLYYIGNVGTGFTDKVLQTLFLNLKNIGRETSPLKEPVKSTNEMHWVDPLYTCKIKFTERTEDGIVRHPVFMGKVKNVQ